MQGLDKYQRTLYIGTFSKTLYPGLRMGYMVLPHELVKPFAYARSMMDGHTPQVLQLTLARFMEDGHYNAHVRAMRKLYAGRRSIMHDAIGKYLGRGRHRPVAAGRVADSLSAESGLERRKTIRQAATAGVQLSGLSKLYAGEPQQYGWLLGYSSLTAYEIEAAMLRLANALKI